MSYLHLINALGALLVSLLTHYLVIDLSHKRGIFIDDHNSDLPQKMHNVPTPRIGGLGIFVAVLFVKQETQLGLYLILCVVPAFLAGFLEDLYAKITPWRRLLIMSISAGMAIYLMDAVVTDFGFIEVPYYVGIVITMVAILGLINGTNMIDGFNGLSSGVCLVIFATFFVVSMRVGDEQVAFVCLVCMAALIGFLFFNFPYGKIFLGDGGAYSLGFLVAVMAIMIVKRNKDISPWFALVSLIYPVWEVIFSFTRRTLIHKLSPLYPDSKHVHQLMYRNIARSNNPRTTMIIIPIVIFFSGLGTCFYDNSLMLFCITLAFIFLYSVFYLVYSRREMQLSEEDSAKNQ